MRSMILEFSRLTLVLQKMPRRLAIAGAAVGIRQSWYARRAHADSHDLPAFYESYIEIRCFGSVPSVSNTQDVIVKPVILRKMCRYLCQPL